MSEPLDFNAALRARIAANLDKHAVAELPPDDRRRAAVAFTLVNAADPADIGGLPHRPEHRTQAAFVLTTRAAKLSSHASQRAYPGGRLDAGETVEQAALRELEEEVGLALGPGDVLGRLDDYPTRSGYVITPVVVWGGFDVRMNANPGEVAQIHCVPLSELLRSDAPLLDRSDDSPNPVLRMPLGDDWFAAPSAAIAYQFREVALLGRDTRVAHYDQPRFAWR